MSTAKEFHVGDILTVITDRLVSPTGVDGVYRILNHLSGDNLFTHQLPRVAREAAPVLKERFPDLAAVEVPEDLDGRAAVDAWLARIVRLHGGTRLVEPLAPAEHTHINALDELALHYSHLPVIPVILGSDE